QYLTFADASGDPDEARFVIIGVPFDGTSSFRSGSRHAPNKIREASYNFETYKFEHGADLADKRFYDAGNTEEFGNADTMVKGVYDYVKKFVDKGKFPILMGGEHSITPAAVKCFKDVGVISLDAHLDFRDSYLNEKNSHACTTRRISDIVGVHNVVPLGVRSLSLEEKEDADRMDLKYVNVYDIIEGEGIESAVETAMNHIKKDKIYLSLDMDVIDPSFAPGISNPEPFGVTPLDVKKVINQLKYRLVGFDVVEVSPPWDNGNTSALAARLIREVLITAGGE
ncbi:MAG: agmatinase, partial [Thermoplasmata archaeon]|nr:agmatinase [Thermoplasmata archaeon]